MLEIYKEIQNYIWACERLTDIWGVPGGGSSVEGVWNAFPYIKIYYKVALLRQYTVEAEIEKQENGIQWRLQKKMPVYMKSHLDRASIAGWWGKGQALSNYARTTGYLCRKKRN